MSFRRMKFFWIALLVSGLLFAVLLSRRNGYFNPMTSGRYIHEISSTDYVPDRNTWKNIYQNGRKIGVSHSTFLKTENGYRLHETLHLRINTMGMTQNVSLDTGGRLNPDFSLAAFDFEISSGRFRFVANGFVTGDVLTIITRGSNATRKQEIKLDKKIYLTAGIIDALLAKKLSQSEVLMIDVFDPATMTQQPVRIKIIGEETIRVAGVSHKANKVSLDFKGVKQIAWVAQSGEILKEQGLMGITLEKTSRDEALFGLPIESSQDLTLVASIASNMLIEDPLLLKTLKIKIDGISFDNVKLDGGRQVFRNGLLTVTKENLSDMTKAVSHKTLQDIAPDFLSPSLFIQSDHPKIKRLAGELVGPADTLLEKASKLVAWMQKNIEKKPVLSLPDALSTLENRVGDCNEHAMLFAALARAVGIPSSVEAGLVYMNGRFYYHAWNSLFVGKWITADALFGQLPADVTHLRFVSDPQKLQLDIMSIIGKLKLEIVEF